MNKKNMLLALAAALLIPAAILTAADSTPASATTGPLNDETLPPGALWLDSLTFAKLPGWGKPGKNAADKPMTLNGVVYPHGIGYAGVSMMRIDLKRAATRFLADFNIDDSTAKAGRVRAFVFVDGKQVYQSEPNYKFTTRKEPYRISVDLTGASELILVGLADQTRGLNANWAGARLLLNPDSQERPEAAAFPDAGAATKPAAGGFLAVESIYHAYIASGYASQPSLGRTQAGEPIMIAGTFYPRGLVVRPRSYIRVDLKGVATQFLARVGVNDGSSGRAEFRVTVDQKVAFDSHFMRAGDPTQAIDVNLAGAKELELTVDGAEGDTMDTAAFAVWLGARIYIKPGVDKANYPEPLFMKQTPVAIAPLADGPEPQIHGPRVVGASPGRAFFFAIPATGRAPLTFAASKLPDGLSLDAATGFITGTMAEPLQQSVDITVRNALGQATRPMAIVCAPYGMTPTPPMGWNSWHAWETSIDDGKIRAAADAMVAKGFAAHGFRYINTDDGWSGPRLADGNLPGAAGRFPDMKALGDYIHGKGLKYGIYASPGEYTCNFAKFLGSVGHEQQDASAWASWGVDYLKYDSCGGGTPERFRLMRKCLDNTGRDIVYSTNTYRDRSAMPQLWRTTVDIRNNWESLNEFAFNKPVGSEKYAEPGRYNDPDMLLVGRPEALTKQNPKFAITRNEEILHVTQWAMLAAPLMLGSNLSEADDALVALMCNDDVLDVNQDPLVRQGWRLRQDSPVRGGGGEVWMRPLFDGTTAVALYNRSAEPIKMKISWKELGLEGPQPVRDCWQRKDLGTFPQDYETAVEVHAAVLLKVGKPATDRFLPPVSAN